MHVTCARTTYRWRSHEEALEEVVVAGEEVEFVPHQPRHMHHTQRAELLGDEAVIHCAAHTRRAIVRES